MGGMSRVAAVWRGELGASATETRTYERLAPVLAAMIDVGVDVEPVLYRDGNSIDVAEQLCRFDGVLVWVDPIAADGDREVLDTMLREVAAHGTWVSAHPDTILKMGTKEVLYRTRSLGWGTDTRLYSTLEEFRAHFPPNLAADRVRVLKQNRGNGGIGVWKVMALDSAARTVRIQHAAPRDDVTEDVALDEFMDRCAAYLDGPGKLVDQPFGSRLREGMIRVYLVEREVVGFARQQPVSREGDANAPELDRVLGMPSAKTMYDADEPEFAELRARLEREWVPDLCRLVDVSDAEVPVLWDADFLYGPRTDRGTDTYVLCEINVSSVIPFPHGVPTKVAAAVERPTKVHS
jgi:hypothetical protein